MGFTLLFFLMGKPISNKLQDLKKKSQELFMRALKNDSTLSCLHRPKEMTTQILFMSNAFHIGVIVS